MVDAGDDVVEDHIRPVELEAHDGGDGLTEGDVPPHDLSALEVADRHLLRTDRVDEAAIQVGDRQELLFLDRRDFVGAELVAAGALVLYLQETFKSDLRHLRGLRPFRPGDHLLLDEVTRRSLELIRTLRDGGRDGSLLSALDRTATTMGARLLQDWLIAPLADRSAIEARLDAVAELHADHRLREDLRTVLAAATDLQRLTSRVSTGRATPSASSRG